MLQFQGSIAGGPLVNSSLKPQMKGVPAPQAQLHAQLTKPSCALPFSSARPHASCRSSSGVASALHPLAQSPHSVQHTPVRLGPSAARSSHRCWSALISESYPAYDSIQSTSEALCEQSSNPGHAEGLSGQADAPSSRCSQSSVPAPLEDAYSDATTSPSTSRRQFVSASAAVLASSSSVFASGLGATPPAQALKQVTLRDGSVVDVFEHGMSLSIVGLKGSIPSDWIVHYRSTLGKYAGFTIGQRDQISDIYKELSDPAGTKNSASIADVISLGDAWLGPAIKKGLLQPIPNAHNSRWWRALSPRWQALLTRNASGAQDPRGDVYAAPYRWSGTLIAYRKDKLLSRGGRPISDWCDLLQPQLEQRVAMTESVREFMGAALKAAMPTELEHVSKGRAASAPRARVGYNTCATALAARGVGVEEVTQAAQTLRKQVKLFSNRDHVRAFGAGDVWAVVGWARDIITLAERSNNVEVLVPASGTALFADVWAVPHGAQGGHMQTGPSPLLPSWLDFCTTPARMANLDNLKSGALPLLLDYYQPDEPKPDGEHDGLVLSLTNGFMPQSTACLGRSEFLLPLDAATTKLYKDALESMGGMGTVATPAAAALK